MYALTAHICREGLTFWPVEEWELFLIWDSAELTELDEEENEQIFTHHGSLAAEQTRVVAHLAFQHTSVLPHMCTCTHAHSWGIKLTDLIRLSMPNWVRGPMRSRWTSGSRSQRLVDSCQHQDLEGQIQQGSQGNLTKPILHQRKCPNLLAAIRKQAARYQSYLARLLMQSVRLPKWMHPKCAFEAFGSYTYSNDYGMNGTMVNHGTNHKVTEII